jgi:hypothetical protein
MADSHSEVTSFETRLEAMDRRLRELQAELALGPPGGDDGAAVSDGIAGPPPTPPTQLEVLAELYGKLVASMRQLLGGYELVAAQLLPAPPVARDGDSAQVALSAGPFAGTAALRDFQRALSQLPGVEAVALRGYEEDDRAIIDVQLR